MAADAGRGRLSRAWGPSIKGQWSLEAGLRRHLYWEALEVSFFFFFFSDSTWVMRNSSC